MSARSTKSARLSSLGRSKSLPSLSLAIPATYFPALLWSFGGNITFRSLEEEEEAVVGVGEKEQEWRDAEKEEEWRDGEKEEVVVVEEVEQVEEEEKEKEVGEG